jgi:hypothetical protein
VRTQFGGSEQRHAHFIQRQRRLHMRQRQHRIAPRQPQQRLAAHHHAGIAGGLQQCSAQRRAIGRGLGQQEHRPIAVGTVRIAQESSQFGDHGSRRIGPGRPIGGGKLLQAGGSGGVDTGHKQRVPKL